ncbi:SAM-dependent methyltransferase [Streptomyces sp. B6B3]|uniref:SAM-dependent methyltransferase n=1 Tax=Streptomyces sp. B6B3 TaxID=3153570 RepID=UPI00325F1480
MEVESVGIVVGGRAEAHDDDWGAERAIVRLDADAFGAEALAGLAEFSHIEVVYAFHLVAPHDVLTGARRPRDNPAWPAVGIFAQRGKARPNRLGVSRCRVRSVDGLDVHVAGLDAIDGTPVLDIKPYMAEFGPLGEVRQPEWATELMRDYY